MPLSSINEFNWKEKSIIYIGEHSNNTLINSLLPYLPPSFIFGKNKFTYEGNVYDKANYSLIINTKNPLQVINQFHCGYGIAIKISAISNRYSTSQHLLG